MNRTEAIETAARWWAKKLQIRRPHSNGDSSPASIFACMLADLGTEPVSDAKLEVFVADLAKRVDKDLREHRTCWLSCDYGPCNLLGEAAKKAGINTMNFPYKTHMNISPMGGDEYKVEVADGYGRPYVELTNERSN